MIVSVAGAMALTLPYPGSKASFAIAVYAKERPADAAGDAMRVSLTFQGVGAKAVIVDVSSTSAIGPLLIIGNAITSCTPYPGTLDVLRPRAFPPANEPHAVSVDGQSLGPARAFSADVAASATRHLCTLAQGARRTDFSSYAFSVLGGYRFFEDSSNAQFDVGDGQLHPALRYSVNLDPSIDDARFEGGAPIDGRPASRRLTADDSATTANWKNTNLGQFREFSLFILAGSFALGLSMLVELIKPLLLDA